MLGGGTFVTMNKLLPGTYVNVISQASIAVNGSDRGYVAYAHSLGWGEDGKIVTVTASDFMINAKKIFGYDYTSDKLFAIREIFQNAKTLYTYKLASGGEKAKCTYATAKYTGTRGNDLKLNIATNPDNGFNVSTYLDNTLVDKQTVAKAEDLQNNDYVDFITSTALVATASMALTGGTDGTVDASAHSTFLGLLESYPSVNAIGYDGTDTKIANLYTAWTKRMRDDVGIKLQSVTYGTSSDYEGSVDVENTEKLVPWVLGAIGGYGVNESITNSIYTGELTEDDLNISKYTQSDLENCITKGKFTVHKVEDSLHVLEDINSLVTTSDTKGDIFKDNKTIRINDTVATDFASIFANEFLGTVPNDDAGRTALKNALLSEHKSLARLRCITYDKDDMTVTEGANNKIVVVTDKYTITGTMEKLYVSIVIS